MSCTSSCSIVIRTSPIISILSSYIVRIINYCIFSSLMASNASNYYFYLWILNSYANYNSILISSSSMTRILWSSKLSNLVILIALSFLSILLYALSLKQYCWMPIYLVLFCSSPIFVLILLIASLSLPANTKGWFYCILILCVYIINKINI